MRKNKILVSILLYVLLLGATAAFVLADTELSVFPGNTITQKDAIFVISVNINTSDSIGGTQFTLNFNPSVLELQSYVGGGFLTKDGGTIIDTSKINNTQGKIDVVLLRNNITGVTGQGSIVNITFKSLVKNGNSNLLLTDIEIDDENGNILNVSAVNNGTVNAATKENVLINEFLPDGDEWVELYNNDTVSIDISKWTISDEVGVRHTFANGTVLGSKAHILVNKTFGLNNDGDTVYLKDNEGTLIDSHGYTSGPGNDKSIGRIHDSLSDWIIFDAPTPNAANNRLPVGNIADQTIDEDNVGSFDVSSGITDPDSDTLTFSIVNENINQVNCNIINETNLTLTPALNWNGIANCTVRVNDGYGIVDKTFYINVNAENDAPTISGVPDQTATEDVNLTLNVAPYINDVDNNKSLLTITQNSAYATVNGQIITFNYPNNVLGENVTITVSDGSLTDSQNIRVNVNGVNDLPVISTIPNIMFDEESYNATIDLDDYVSDEEYSDENISWSVSGNLANLIININSQTHILNVSASKDWYGTRNIILTATDFGGSSASTNINVTVNNVNDAPYFTSTPSLTATEAIEYSYDANANDIDSNVSQLVFSIVTAPSGATINSATGLFAWKPSAAQVGINEVELKVQDFESDFVTQKFNITVLPVLDIIDININGQDVNDGDTVGGLAPGIILPVQYKVKNRFPAETNKAIVGIETSASISAYSLEGVNSGIILEGQQTQLIEYDFQIPYTANIENFDVELSTSGIDLYDKTYSSSKKVNLVLDRDFHRVEITNKSWSNNNLTCDRDTTLTVTLANTGNWSETGTVNVYNAKTNKNETKAFTLNVAEKADITFDVDASAATNNEEFDITVKYRYDYPPYTIYRSIELMIHNCLNSAELNNLLKVNESEAPTWSNVNLKDYTYGDTTGLAYNIVGENATLIDCSVTAGGIFNCGIPADDLYGISVINMNVGDVTEQFNVEVLSKNDPPVISTIPDVTFNEGGNNNTVDLDDYVEDIDNSDNELSWTASGNQNVTVVINPSTHIINFGTINQNWYGVENINFKVRDPRGLEDNQTITVTVIKQLDDLPSITDDFSPKYDPLIGDNVVQPFSITISDPDVINPLTTWYVNGNEISTGLTFDFSQSTGGIYKVTANLTNSSKTVSYGTKSWNNVRVSELPVTTYEGTIRSVGPLNVSSFIGLTIEKPNVGKIVFGDPIDLRDVVDVDSNVKIEAGIVGVDSDAYGFNVFKIPAIITMYNLPFTETPKIYYNSGFSTNGTTECPSSICTGVYYTNGTLTFSVAYFSTFFVDINRPPTISPIPDQTAILDEEYKYDVEATDPDRDLLHYSLTTNLTGINIDGNGLITWTPKNITTESVTVSVTDGINIVTQSFNIEVKEGVKLSISDLDVKVADKTSKDLKDGDTISRKAKPGDKVKFDIEVGNLFSKSADITIDDITVTVTIEEIDDGDDLEDDVDIEDLDAGDDDSVTIEFTVPTLVEEDTYDVTIEVDGEDENGKDQEVRWELKLEVKKDKHELIIDDISLNPSSIKCDRNPNLELKIVNIGKEDEDDISIEIKNNNLGIDTGEEEIELDSGDDEDSVFENTYRLDISDDVEAGIYPISVEVNYDSNTGGEETVNLMVEDCIEVITPVKEAEPVEVVTTPPTITKPVAPVTKISFKDTSEYLTLLVILFIILAGGVIFLIGGVIIISRKR